MFEISQITCKIDLVERFKDVHLFRAELRVKFAPCTVIFLNSMLETALMKRKAVSINLKLDLHRACIIV